MKKYKYMIPIIIVALLLISAFSSSLFAKAEVITISGIKAHDFFTNEPSTYEEVRATLKNRPPERTGYSGKLYLCENGTWVQEGEDINTDDSGRDKRYNVADYKDQIIKLYDKETYELALASGESLVFDASKGKQIIYSSGNSGTKLPCKDGQGGYFYNNLDFWLTLTFTKPDIQPPPSKESVRIEPSERIVEVGDRGSYKLYHYDNNGNKTDVTDAATWSISSDKIGKAAGKGIFEGLSIGSTSVKATYKTFSDSASFKVIEAKAKPEVKILGPTTVKAGELFSLYAAANVAGGTIDEYIWDFHGADGGEPNKANLNQLYYMEQGEKYVTVAVRDNFDQWAFAEHYIEVIPPTPTAGIGVSGALKENRKVTLTDQSSSPHKFPITDEVTVISGVDNDETLILYQVKHEASYNSAEVRVAIGTTDNGFIYDSNKHGFDKMYRGTDGDTELQFMFSQGNANSAEAFKDSNIKIDLDGKRLFVLSSKRKYQVLDYYSEVIGDRLHMGILIKEQ